MGISSENKEKYRKEIYFLIRKFKRLDIENDWKYTFSAPLFYMNVSF